MINLSYFLPSSDPSKNLWLQATSYSSNEVAHSSSYMTLWAYMIFIQQNRVGDTGVMGLNQQSMKGEGVRWGACFMCAGEGYGDVM